MSKIVYIADGAAFNSRMLGKQAMGGAESACIHFVKALADASHDVTVYTTAGETYSEDNLHWKPLASFVPQSADIVFAHRSPHLFSAYPVNAKRKILYLHNPASYLNKWRHRKYIYKHKPEVIFSGNYHASTWPKWLPKTNKLIIPYAVDNAFKTSDKRDTPKPRAIFTSNPLRSLDWLLDTWERYIAPACPEAELHLYCGPEVYPGLKQSKAKQMQAVLEQAKQLKDKGVVIHKPLARDKLIEALSQARVMLYRGDPGESYCLALAEAQALGVPVVTAGIGSTRERVIDGKTGFIAAEQQAFANAAIRLLQQDTLWQQQHQASLNKTPYCWHDAIKIV